jgi:hypothetical protein
MSDVILRGVLNMPLENSIDIEQRHARILELTKQRDALAEALASLLSGVKNGWYNDGKWWHTGIEQAEQALAAAKGGSHE